jgi:hypothetical protein
VPARQTQRRSYAEGPAGSPYLFQGYPARTRARHLERTGLRPAGNCDCLRNGDLPNDCLAAAAAARERCAIAHHDTLSLVLRSHTSSTIPVSVWS